MMSAAAVYPMSKPTQLLSPRMYGLLQRIQRAQRTPLHALDPEQARSAYSAAAEILELPRTPLRRVEGFALPAAGWHDTSSAVVLRCAGSGPHHALPARRRLCHRLAGNARQPAAASWRCAAAAPWWLWTTGWRRSIAFRPLLTTPGRRCSWLHANAAALGLDGTRLAVGGDSAGGTLAAVCALRGRDEGLALALQLLITPGTSAYGDTASRRLFATGFLLDMATIDWFFDHYIEHAQRPDWRFAPLNHDDLEGVAPACVILAECDPLVDEGFAYADRLRAAGVR